MKQHIKDLSMEIAAQCWCDNRTAGTDMDPVLAEVFAEKLAVWLETTAQEMENKNYYKELLRECGNYLGSMNEDIYRCDDGTIVDEPLLAKVPEILKDFMGTTIS